MQHKTFLILLLIAFPFYLNFQVDQQKKEVSQLKKKYENSADFLANRIGTNELRIGKSQIASESAFFLQGLVENPTTTTISELVLNYEVKINGDPIAQQEVSIGPLVPGSNEINKSLFDYPADVFGKAILYRISVKEVRLKSIQRETASSQDL